MSVRNEHGPTMSGGFMEAMFDTLIALAIAAAICVGVISLSVHLNEARIARGRPLTRRRQRLRSRHPAPPAPRISTDTARSFALRTQVRA